MFRPLLLACALLPLAACDDGKEGTSFSINTSDADGNAAAGIDGKGEATIDTPFFKGKVTLPRLKFDATSFDMNGVHLYPGSTISGRNIDAHDKPGSDNDGRLRVAFDSPAAPATVRDWFKNRLNAAKFSVVTDGDGLKGKTDEDKPFTLHLTPDGVGKAKGVITIE